MRFGPPSPLQSMMLLGSGQSGSGESIDPPTNLTLPERAGIGDEYVGDELSLSNTGTWTGSPTLSYQWFNSSGDISGANGATYLLTESDAGLGVGCRVTATNAGGSVSVDANGAFTTKALGLTNTGTPSASSDSGNTPANLTCSEGSWDSNPQNPTITYQWRGPSGALGTDFTQVGESPGEYYCEVTALANYSGAPPVTVNSNTIALTTPE